MLRISLCRIFFLGLLILTASSTRAGADLKFCFNSAPPGEGYTLVKPGQLFDQGSGFGFEPVAGAAPDDAGQVALQPFYFSVVLPEGNYRVTVTLGDPTHETETTVKAELRRLMLENVKTTSGEILTRSFVVNIRTPAYPGGEVHLKSPRESKMEAWAWDNKLTLEINGHRPGLRTLVIEPVQVPTVFILGDSTVCDQPGEPFASWGQMLPRFFKPDIAVSNNAESGETLRTSTDAHRLDKVLSMMQPGDYLLIQYGHNDMKSKDPNASDTYKATLKQWCEKVKQKGGIPVLLTSMNRHTFKGDVVVNSLKDYPDKVRDAAKDEGVALIDLNAMSKTLYESFGETGSIALFEHAPGSKKFDATHHSPFGAYELAKCVLQGIRDDHLDLASHIADDVRPFDPAKPDLEANINIPSSPVVTRLRPLGD